MPTITFRRRDDPQEESSLTRRAFHFTRLALAVSLAWADASIADPLPTDPLQLRCWTDHTAQRTAVDLREPKSVTFSNLRNGFVVRSPFWIEFGVRGMGVIPANNPHERAGHHHLLVDAPLPAQHDAKIPFSDTHRHFGKAQTGSALDLPPGRHTLRLLFADHDHRPYFVYSPEIVVEIVGKRAEVAAPVIDAARYDETCQRWYEDQMSTPRPPANGVYVKNLRDDEPVSSPFTLSFGVVGFGVAPASSNIKDTGHFVLTVLRGGAPVSVIDLADGRTETTMDLPRGEFQLELIFKRSDGAVLLKAPSLRVSVVARKTL
jgi:hypothetical protein